MQTESLVDRLCADLHPVRPRKAIGDVVLLVLLATAELAAFLSIGFMRPDMPNAMTNPSFWWKMAGCSAIAAIGFVTAIGSMNPVRSPRPGLTWLSICTAVIFLTGWFVDAAQQGLAGFMARLDWVHGLQCVKMVVILSIPPTLAFGIIMRRGAPTDRSGTTLAAAFGSAAWGAFVFAFACPYDDPFYNAVWYTVACATVILAARPLLLALSRW